MFSIFSSKPVKDDKAMAREAFEKVAALRTDSREARSARVRLGLLCRGHIDKTFIDGAEKTSTWEDDVTTARARGREAPTKPVASNYQTMSTGSGQVTVYLPEEIVTQVFLLGERYQNADLSAPAAIQAVQTIADQLFRIELRMDEPFEVLQFLRNELAQADSAPAQAAASA